MNTNTDNTSLDDPRFDRLVDGELSEPERRELLTGLDSEPGGWRRCALAFLESQCWKQSLNGSFQTKRAEPGPVGGVCELPARHSRWSNHLGTVLAMAACFFAAFWVFSAVQRMHHDRPVTTTGTPTEVASAAGARQAPSARLSSGPWRMVTVAAPGGSANGGAALRVPAVERKNIDSEWLGSLPSAVPDNVMQALNRTGHQVEQHRELVPVSLQDGRQMVMPVDQVKVHYVGNDTTY